MLNHLVHLIQHKCILVWNLDLYAYMYMFIFFQSYWNKWMSHIQCTHMHSFKPCICTDNSCTRWCGLWDSGLTKRHGVPHILFLDFVHLTHLSKQFATKIVVPLQITFLRCLCTCRSCIHTIIMLLLSHCAMFTHTLVCLEGVHHDSNIMLHTRLSIHGVHTRYNYFNFTTL